MYPCLLITLAMYFCVHVRSLHVCVFRVYACFFILLILLQVRAEFRKVLMYMGFEEMPTNRWVESSFWNFDSLFQPQVHKRNRYEPQRQTMLRLSPRFV